MDGNKDAAQSCLDIGIKALKDGDKAKALKFLTKAQRLDPSLRLGTLVSSVRKEVKDAGVDQHAQDEIKRHVSGTSRVKGDSASNGVASAEQIEVVHCIRKTKDYYQILGLSKDCTTEEIRKAYKKISLKVHPDKNSAPGAEEAFKLVSKAFACLNEEDSRAKYDQYGSEDPNRLANQNAARYHNARNVYAYGGDMFDADEIFNSFFFGTGNAFQRTQYVRRYRTARSTQAEAGNRSTENSGGLVTLLQVLPVLALFLISLIPLSSSVYSMEQVAPYQFQYSTKAHQVPFYVKSVDFEKDYPPGSSYRRNVEVKVERDMVGRLGYSCRRELQQQRWNPTMRTPNCDRLQAFYDD